MIFMIREKSLQVSGCKTHQSVNRTGQKQQIVPLSLKPTIFENSATGSGSVYDDIVVDIV